MSKGSHEKNGCKEGGKLPITMQIRHLDDSMSTGSHEEDLPQHHESNKHLQLAHWGQIEHREL